MTLRKKVVVGAAQEAQDLSTGGALGRQTDSLDIPGARAQPSWLAGSLGSRGAASF